MKVLQVITLLLLLAGFSGGVEARERGLGHRSSSGSSSDDKKGKGGGGGVDRSDPGGGVIDLGLVERHDCLLFNDAFVQTAIETSGGNHDGICNSNDCGSTNSPGCCRIHNNLLRCDVTNDYAQQPVRKRSSTN